MTNATSSTATFCALPRHAETFETLVAELDQANRRYREAEKLPVRCDDDSEFEHAVDDRLDSENALLEFETTSMGDPAFRLAVLEHKVAILARRASIGLDIECDVVGLAERLQHH